MIIKERMLKWSKESDSIDPGDCGGSGGGVGQFQEITSDLAGGRR